jgi:hypothetical protein
MAKWEIRFQRFAISLQPSAFRWRRCNMGDV